MNPRTASIDHHPRAKDELCAPQMFTHGHTLQLGSVLRAHLVNLVARTGLLPGISEQVFVDIDSLLRPVFGHAKQGASYGHTKIAGKQVLRKGLSPLATTLSTRDRGAGDRGDPAPRRPGRLGQGCGVDGHRRHHGRPRRGRGR